MLILLTLSKIEDKIMFSQKDKDFSVAFDVVSDLASAVKRVEADGSDVIVHAARAREQVSEPFVLLFYESISELVIDEKISMGDMKVVLGVCQIARFGNLISLNQAALAGMLKMHKVSVSRSIKKLTEMNVLIKSDLGLFINPTLIVKGALNKIEPEIWNETIKRGFSVPVKSVVAKTRN